MSTIIRAERRLREGGEISPSRKAGLIYRPDGSIAFLANLKAELDPILYQGDGATKTAFELASDNQQMNWVVMDDGNFTDLVSSVYTVGNAMGANGAGGNLLAAVFQVFLGPAGGDRGRTGARAYWIYRYDRKAFYPFVPTGDKPGERDRPSETYIAGLARRQGLAIERSYEEWMGLWGIPF